MFRKIALATAGPLLAVGVLLGGAMPAQALTAPWATIPFADGTSATIQTITAQPSNNLTGFQVDIPGFDSVHIVVTDPSDSVVFDQVIQGPVTAGVFNLNSPLPVAKNSKFTMSVSS